MKSKYVMIQGFAFSEKSDMEKLSNYAKEGWILEGITAGFFYKLRKSEPQHIVYSLDYQNDIDEEYLDIFKEAGWNLVVSIGKQMHIFSAPQGTEPIYSDSKSEMEKYIYIRDETKKGILCSFIIAIVLAILSMIPLISKFVEILLIIDLVIFIFNFMPYLAYNSKVNKMKKCGESKKSL